MWLSCSSYYKLHLRGTTKWIMRACVPIFLYPKQQFKVIFKLHLSSIIFTIVSNSAIAFWSLSWFYKRASTCCQWEKNWYQSEAEEPKNTTHFNRFDFIIIFEFFSSLFIAVNVWVWVGCAQLKSCRKSCVRKFSDCASDDWFFHHSFYESMSDDAVITLYRHAKI